PLQCGMAGEKDEVTVQHLAAKVDAGLRIFPVIRLGEGEGVEINLHQAPPVAAAIGRQRVRPKWLGVFPRCEISRSAWTGGLQEQSPARLARTDAADHRGLKTELLSSALDELLVVIGCCGLRQHRRIARGNRGRKGCGGYRWTGHARPPYCCLGPFFAALGHSL